MRLEVAYKKVAPRRASLLALLVFLTVAPPSITPAPPPQDGAKADRARDADEIIRVETNLITVPVSVMDREGRYVANLTKEDFLLLEDGNEQEVAFFGPVERPVTVALVLDVSSSMTDLLPAVLSAANVFAGQMRPADQLLIVLFDNSVMTALDTTPVREIGPDMRIDISPPRAGGHSVLHDAVRDTLRKRLNKIAGRKAMILFTDGLEGGSEASEATVRRETEESETPIYAVQYPPATHIGGKRTKVGAENVRRATAFLTGLAARTGGRHFRAENISDIERAFAAVGDELRHQYSLGYYPKSRDGAGRERRIQVKVRRPNVVIHARPGYTAGATPKDR